MASHDVRFRGLAGQQIDQFEHHPTCLERVESRGPYEVQRKFIDVVHGVD